MKVKFKSASLKVPTAVKKALAGNVKAKAVFEDMPPSHRNEYVKWISEAKKEETKQRRIEQLIPKLLAKA